MAKKRKEKRRKKLPPKVQQALEKARAFSQATYEARRPLGSKSAYTTRSNRETNLHSHVAEPTQRGNPPGSCGSDADRMKCSTESATLGRLRCSTEAGMPGGAPKRYGICSAGEPAGSFVNEGSRRLQRSMASLSLHMISFSAPALSVVIPRSPRLSIPPPGDAHVSHQKSVSPSRDDRSETRDFTDY